MDYKPGDTGTYPGDMKQGAKISWPKAIEIIQNLLFVWNYVRNQYQKIFENNPHIFKWIFHSSWNKYVSTTESCKTPVFTLLFKNGRSQRTK